MKRKDTAKQTANAAYLPLVFKPLTNEPDSKLAVIHPETNENLGDIDPPMQPLIEACYNLYMRTLRLLPEEARAEQTELELTALMSTDYEKAVNSTFYQIALNSYNGFKAIVGEQSLASALEGRERIKKVESLLALLSEDGVPTRLSDQNIEVARVFADAFQKVSDELITLRDGYIEHKKDFKPFVKPIATYEVNKQSKFTGNLAAAYREAIYKFDNHIQGVDVLSGKPSGLIHKLESRYATLYAEHTDLTAVVASVEDNITNGINDEGHYLDRRQFAVTVKEACDSVYLPVDTKKEINQLYDDFFANYKPAERKRTEQLAAADRKDNAAVKKPNILSKLFNAVDPDHKKRNKVQSVFKPNQSDHKDAALDAFKDKVLEALRARQAEVGDAHDATKKKLKSARRNPFKWFVNLFVKMFRAIKASIARGKVKRVARKAAKAANKAQAHKQLLKSNPAQDKIIAVNKDKFRADANRVQHDVDTVQERRDSAMGSPRSASLLR